jgi:hypothetical protein
MSIGTFCLRTIVIELPKKKNSMVKKRMEKNPRRMTPHLWKLEYNRNRQGMQIIYVSYIYIYIYIYIFYFSEF